MTTCLDVLLLLSDRVRGQHRLPEPLLLPLLALASLCADLLQRRLPFKTLGSVSTAHLDAIPSLFAKPASAKMRVVRATMRLTLMTSCRGRAKACVADKLRAAEFAPGLLVHHTQSLCVGHVVLHHEGPTEPTQ